MATATNHNKAQTNEAQGNRLAAYMAERQRARQIQTEDEETASDLSEAPVKTGKGLPDMRFAYNRNLYLFDKKKRVNGDPDRRLVENREDIQALHEAQGDGMPNVSFSER